MLFSAIANNFNCKIFTSKQKRKILLQLEDKDLSARLTDDPLETFLHCTTMSHITMEVSIMTLE
jgi:hypothetical protein